MNADAFRHYFDYHFNENRSTWDKYVTPLSDDQFTQSVGYSHGSVRNQILHLMSVDEAWFSGLRGVEIPEAVDPASIADRSGIRRRWDAVEHDMRRYLEKLQDKMLFEKPFAEGEDKDLVTWQVLLQVGNHGTDHRAQLLRLLNDLGVNASSPAPTFSPSHQPV